MSLNWWQGWGALTSAVTSAAACVLCCACSAWCARSSTFVARGTMSFAKPLPQGIVSYMPKHLPPIRHGYRPDWWWPKRSVEVAALRELGELHYWERPSDPLWFERHVEPVVSPLAEQSAAQLAATPPSCVPHLPYLPHPWPRSPRPFHVASPVGTPDAARLLSDGHSPVTAQAPTGDAGLEGGGGAMFMDGWADDADWAPLAEGIAEAVSEAVSDGFSEYAHASMLDDLSGVRARQGGLGVRRAVGLEGVDCLVFSRLKPTG